MSYAYYYAMMMQGDALAEVRAKECDERVLV